MATKKKGCGFLITALVLLLLGGGIAGFLGLSAVNSGKDFIDKINEGEAFISPGVLTYSADEDSEVTIWITGDQTEDFSGINVEFTDSSGNTTPATKAGTSSHMGNQHLIGTFSVKKGETYKVKATGADSARTFRISTISSTAVLAMVGKGFGAFAAFGVCALIALIFGIIGLVKFFGSKNSSPAQPQAPPAA